MEYKTNRQEFIVALYLLGIYNVLGITDYDCGNAKNGSRQSTKVYVKNNLIDRQYFPWVAKIACTNQFEIKCLGSFISHDTIVTAATCFHGYSDYMIENTCKVVLIHGTFRKFSTFESDIKSITTVEKINYTMNEDIALIKLVAKVGYSNITLSNVCLNSSLRVTKENVCVLANHAEYEVTDTFVQYDFHFLENEHCFCFNNDYDETIHSCGNSAVTVRAILPGAPVYCSIQNQWYLHSISSQTPRGRWCEERRESPHYFTKIARYVDWLQKNGSFQLNTVIPPKIQTTSLPTTHIWTETTKTTNTDLGPACGISHTPQLRDPRDKVSQGTQPLIANGVNAVPHSWPWHVAIFKNSSNTSTYICGGTLISEFHILTAAHCKENFNSLHDYSIVLGGHNLYDSFEGQTSVKIRDFTEADGNNFLLNDWLNDAAVITLMVRAPFGDSIATACLPSSNDSLVVGQLCYVIGWGNENRLSKFLQQGAVVIRNEDECLSIASNFNSKTMICAGDECVDTCKGDSGGPLLCETNGHWYVYGVTSRGNSNCGSGKPAIYTKVAFYETWIRKIKSM